MILVCLVFGDCVVCYCVYGVFDLDGGVDVYDDGKDEYCG